MEATDIILNKSNIPGYEHKKMLIKIKPVKEYDSITNKPTGNISGYKYEITCTGKPYTTFIVEVDGKNRVPNFSENDDFYIDLEELTGNVYMSFNTNSIGNKWRAKDIKVLTSEKGGK